MTKKDYSRSCVHCGKSPIRVSKVKKERCCTCGKWQKEQKQQEQSKKKKKK